MTGRTVDSVAAELAKLRREYDSFRSTVLGRFPTSDRVQGVVPHHWANTGTHNIDHGDTDTFTSWTNVVDGGIATRSGGNFFLNRAGRWSMMLDVGSDATFTGVLKVQLNWPSGAFGVNTMEDVRYRGGGFAFAGNLRTVLTWSGWVDADDGIDTAITCSALWIAGDSSTDTDVTIHRLSLNYMGSA